MKPQKSDDIPFRGRQRTAGTAIVDFRQLDLLHMPKRIGAKAKFTFAETESGEINFEEAAQKRTIFEYDGVKFAITAKPDGILDYEGSRLIFEYKTKASGLRAMNGKLDWKGAEESHIRQVVAESLVFGIRECIILYESTQKPAWFSDEDNRNVTKGQKTWADGKPMPDLRPFYIYVTDEMQDALIRDLARQAAIVYGGEKPWITAEMTGKCGFCPYFGGHCQAEISAENLAELRGIEERYAKSSFAGKRDHRDLVNYLAEAKEAVK